ncbi:unnamed protein product [Heterobilharzia americana]|nr:unnamed protein product [Heterobilharzia americana]
MTPVDSKVTLSSDNNYGLSKIPSKLLEPVQCLPIGVTDDKEAHVSVEAIRCEDDSSPVHITYSNVKTVGNGSFGIVYYAVLGDNREVAIKKVLQDKRYKNRELQILRILHHSNIVPLYYYFYSSSSSKPGETYLNLIQEYIPQTLSRLIRHYWRIRQVIPLAYVKLYSFQLLRGLAYIHNQGICHRDIKPQNLLINLDQGVLKICDFGSAKILNPEEANVSYICSRYYRAPELIFGATHYTVQIDMWSAGCVIGELLLGRPLFPGESGVDQLVEIIKVLGTPTREQVHEMNPQYSEFNFPNIQGCSWEKLIRNRSTDTAFYILQKLLVYDPKVRMTASEILGCCFFSDLILPPPGHPADATGHLPSGKPAPSFVNQFTEEELSYLPKEMATRLIACKNAIALKSHSIVNLTTLDNHETLNSQKKYNSASSSYFSTSTSTTSKGEQLKYQKSNISSHDSLLTPRLSLQLPKGNRKNPKGSVSNVYFNHNDTLRSNSGNPYQSRLMTLSVRENQPIQIDRCQYQRRIVENSKCYSLRDSQPCLSLHSNEQVSHIPIRETDMTGNSRSNTLRKATTSQANHVIQMNKVMSVKSIK